MKSVFLFVFLLLFLSSCSKKSEPELFKEGQAAEEQQNFQLAIERYQEIVDRFPGKAYADSAVYRTAVIYNNDVHDFVKAVRTYQQYYTMFPNSEEAPTAMFLSGFILNNELHKLDSAKIVYETFLQKYPGHQLASSAEFELETLGKDPGQFIKTDVASTEDEMAKKTKKEFKK
jgi:outer membrane protein assembly factor BamD (BamD/ComL family)